MGVDLGRLEIEDRLVLHQRHAGFGRDLRHPAAMRRGDQMLHLHGFEHGDLLAGADEISFLDVDGDNRALQRRRHRDRAGRPGCRCREPQARASRHRRRCRIRSAPSRPFALASPTRAATWVSMKPVLRRLLDKIRMRQDRRQEGNVGGDAADPELAQGARGLVHDVGPVTARRMHDDLGEQRVEGGAGPVAGVTKRIDANAGAGRQVEQSRACRRSAWSRRSRPSPPC